MPGTKLEVGNWFRSQLGYSEGPNNSNRFAALAGHKNNEPWCGSFIVAGFRANGLKLPSESAFTPAMLAALRADGRRIAGPQVGALAFLYFPALKRVAHVGWVESVRKDGRFVTIEGNTDVKGGRTGGRVMRKVRSSRGFTFVMPEYATVATPPTKVGPKPGRPDITELQKILHLPEDNQWGPMTDNAFSAVRAAARDRKFPFGTKPLQRVIGTPVDGIWGDHSRRALRNTVFNLQKELSRLGWELGKPNGAWTPKTEEAYKAVRTYSIS